MAELDIAGALVIAVAIAAFGTAWAPQQGEPLWEIPTAWVLPHIPPDRTVLQHLAAGAGSLTEVGAALSFVDYQRAAEVWDEAHEAQWWFDFNRTMDAAVAAFHASDYRIDVAHDTVPCRRCVGAITDEFKLIVSRYDTAEWRFVPRRPLGPRTLVGVL